MTVVRDVLICVPIERMGLRCLVDLLKCKPIGVVRRIVYAAKPSANVSVMKMPVFMN